METQQALRSGTPMPDVTADDLTEQPINGKKAEKKGGKRIGYNYIIYKSLKESRKNDVVKCFYIRRWNDFGFCVIKEGTAGETKDKLGRDIRDRLIWQEKLHQDLYDKLPLPKYIGSFEEHGNYYLAIQYVPGVSLYEKLKKNKKEILESLKNGGRPLISFMGYLLQVIALLEKLHSNGFIHRDVTPSNFMINRSGKVFVIDLELAYQLNNAPDAPFQLGTDGYMSPEQRTTEAPAIEQDVFSVGAIILETISPLHPIKVTDARSGDWVEKVRFFVEDQQLSDLIIRCFDPVPSNRPRLQAIRGELESYVADMKRNICRKKVENRPFYSDAHLLQTIERAMKSLASPLLSDDQKGWFTDRFLFQHERKSGRAEKAWFASFSRGCAGIMYMISRAGLAGFDTEAVMPIFETGMKTIRQRYIEKMDRVKAGLFEGSDGIAVALTCSLDAGFVQNQGETMAWIRMLLEKPAEFQGLARGLAGQGMAQIRCSCYLDPQLNAAALHGYADRLMQCQFRDGSWSNDQQKRKTGPDKGLGEGVAGIVLFLLNYEVLFPNAGAGACAHKGLEWLMRKAAGARVANGRGWAYGLKDGAAGISLVFLKAYQFTGDPVYKSYFERIILECEPSILDDNLSQLHGLSGLGEVFLEAFTILQDEKWLHKASEIAQFIACLKMSYAEDCVFWLTGGEKRPVPDFMVGNSGIIHFLMRYLKPDKLPFPLLF